MSALAFDLEAFAPVLSPLERRCLKVMGLAADIIRQVIERDPCGTFWLDPLIAEASAEADWASSILADRMAEAQKGGQL